MILRVRLQAITINFGGEQFAILSMPDNSSGTSSIDKVEAFLRGKELPVKGQLGILVER